jgi:hypothetical protein
MLTALTEGTQLTNGVATSSSIAATYLVGDAVDLDSAT